MVIQSLKKEKPATSLISRNVDFWLLGGASIAIWIVMVIFQPMREMHSVDTHFLQLAGVFSFLSLFCNHPHFMISYRFGYGSGIELIRKKWFALLLVPIALLLLFVSAYFSFDQPIAENSYLLGKGLDERNLGTALLSIAAWIMYVTVGWHYSKQVFGCVMVYSRFDKYPINLKQRNLLKMSVFSVAVFNFLYFSSYIIDSNRSTASGGIQISSLGLPKLLSVISISVTILLALSVIYFIFYKNFIERQLKPSINLLVPWIAFFIWWIPPMRQMEYFVMIVPFFHSLQYLPFAYKVEASKIEERGFNIVKIPLSIFALLVVGFLAFEFIPEYLDSKFETFQRTELFFFLTASLLFINIHHFFIDSVVWRFNSKSLRQSIFGE